MNDETKPADPQQSARPDEYELTPEQDAAIMKALWASVEPEGSGPVGDRSDLRPWERDEAREKRDAANLRRQQAEDERDALRADVARLTTERDEERAVRFFRGRSLAGMNTDNDQVGYLISCIRDLAGCVDRLDEYIEAEGERSDAAFEDACAVIASATALEHAIDGWVGELPGGPFFVCAPCEVVTARRKALPIIMGWASMAYGRMRLDTPETPDDD